MPKVSVIIPVYNVEKYLSACLKSVCEQTLHDIEIICVDDGSKDHSLDILRGWQNKDNRIRIFQQQNSGAGTARNLGMREATGEYLSFLDSDDVFEADLLKTMTDRADQDKADVVVCRADQFDTLTGQHNPIDWSIREDLLPPHIPFKSQDVKRNFFELFVWWPWDKLFRKKYIDQTGLQFQSLRTTNDLFFVCAATLLAPRISYVNDVLVHQRINVKSSLSRTREKSWNNYLKALVALKDFMIEKNIYMRFEQDFINYSLNFSLWHLDTMEGHSYTLLYQALKDKWFQKLGILTHEINFFYRPENFNRVQEMLLKSPEEVLFEKIHMLESERDSLLLHVRSVSYDYDKMKNSISFRIGRMITWLPRKIRDTI